MIHGQISFLLRQDAECDCEDDETEILFDGKTTAYAIQHAVDPEFYDEPSYVLNRYIYVDGQLAAAARFAELPFVDMQP